MPPKLWPSQRKQQWLSRPRAKGRVNKGAVSDGTTDKYKKVAVTTTKPKPKSKDKRTVGIAKSRDKPKKVAVTTKAKSKPKNKVMVKRAYRLKRVRRLTLLDQRGACRA